MIKRENYITIQGFMVTDLGLKGNDLIVYAIIYGFSQDGINTFNGGTQYLADWTHSTKRGIYKNIQSLIDKGYLQKIEKVINGVKFCEYIALVPGGGEQSSPVGNTVPEGSEQSSPGVVNKVPRGGEQSSPNNIDNNIDNNIRDINSVKHKHGEYQNVLLTDEELQKLQAEYPDWQQRIERLSGYMASKGVKYKSHYATIRNWARKDGVRNTNAGAVPHPYTNNSGNKYSARYQSL